MGENHHSISVKLGGIPMRVRFRFENNGAFFSDYITEEKPLLVIDPSDEDVERIRNQMALSSGENGMSGQKFRPDFIERNVLHSLVAEQLVSYDVLLMHGSALCMDSQAFLFTAQSGVGKSTQARLWREVFGDRVRMINDDKPLLQIRDSDVLVWGSPWNGKHRLSSNICAPLKSVAALHQAAENRVVRMTDAEAFSVLRQRAYQAISFERGMTVIELEKKILSMIPFYDLWCNMRPEAAEVAFREMASGLTRRMDV